MNSNVAFEILELALSLAKSQTGKLATDCADYADFNPLNPRNPRLIRISIHEKCGLA